MQSIQIMDIDLLGNRCEVLNPCQPGQNVIECWPPVHRPDQHLVEPGCIQVQLYLAISLWHQKEPVAPLWCLIHIQWYKYLLFLQPV